MLDRKNFYMGTIANFRKIERPTREPDYISKSGSEYWYTDKGVIRYSGHWNTDISSCNWYLKDGNCGYCSFKNFKFKEMTITVYVKNYDLFTCFNYDGQDYSGHKYFKVQLTEENLKDGYVYWMGRTCKFMGDTFMSIDFDF